MTSIALGVLSVLAAVSLALAIYFTARRAFAQRADDDTANLAGSIIFRLAALHSLILALVFAQEQVNYVSLRDTTVHEAAALADLFYDLHRYDPASTAPARASVARYAETVRGSEWRSLAEGRLSSVAWAQWDLVYKFVLDLEPEGLRQTDLRSRMLEDIDAISDFRNERLAASNSAVPAIFWVAAIGGFVVIVMPFFTFSPRPINLLLLTLFAGYNGMVLFFIAVLNNPFAEPASLGTLPFDLLVADDMGEFLERPGLE
jgi:hypothetical protein